LDITAVPTQWPAPSTPTGQAEFNGTSIVDVTDPAHPVYLHHLPGQDGNYEQGGAQMVRVCDGDTLPKGDPSAIYIYVVDRANTGLHILELTGAARAIAGVP
jgi:hypothetical protein